MTSDDILEPDRYVKHPERQPADLTSGQRAVLILDTPMDDSANDSGAATIRGYLAALLAGVWRDRECFDGKRPFGNSSWEWDLYLALAKAGHLSATWDERGYIDEFDRDAADELIDLAIAAMGGAA